MRLRLIFFLLLGFALHAQPKLSLSGVINGYKGNGTVVIANYFSSEEIGSAKIIGNRFKIEQMLDEADLFNLIIDPGSPNESRFLLFLDNEEVNIEITNDFDFVIKKGMTSQLYDKIFKEVIRECTEFDSINYSLENTTNSDKETAKRLRKKRLDILNSIKSKVYNFVKENPSSPVSAYAINFVFFRSSEILNIYNLLELLHSPAKESKHAKLLEADLKGYHEEILTLGKQAPDFFQFVDLESYVNSRSYRGKYLILVFWASWSKPSRSMNKELVTFYNNIKDNKFDVIGISLDQKNTEYQAAIKEDSLPWINLCDYKYWNTDIARLYNIKHLPNTILIDPNGIIVGKNLDVKSMEKIIKDANKKF